MWLPQVTPTQLLAAAQLRLSFSASRLQGSGLLSAMHRSLNALVATPDCILCHVPPPAGEDTASAAATRAWESVHAPGDPSRHTGDGRCVCVVPSCHKHSQYQYTARRHCRQHHRKQQPVKQHHHQGAGCCSFGCCAALWAMLIRSMAVMTAIFTAAPAANHSGRSSCQVRRVLLRAALTCPAVVLFHKVAS
jgi:hypothetical protein